MPWQRASESESLLAAPQPQGKQKRHPVDRVRLVLPLPPTVNQLWMPDGRGGICRTPAYRAWIDAAGWTLLSQRPGRVAGAYDITIELPRTARGDADNYIKGASDLCQAHGVIDNDRMADAVHVIHGDGAEFSVTIARAEAQP